MKFNYLFFGPIRKLIFFKNFLKYIKSDKSDFFQRLFLIYFIRRLKEFFLSEIKQNKNSFCTTRMQILRHVTDLVGGSSWHNNNMGSQTILHTRYKKFKKHQSNENSHE